MNAPEVVDEAIIRLRQVRGILDDGGLSRKAARHWLHEPNARLDGRAPVTLILAGEGRQVVAEARRETGR